MGVHGRVSAPHRREVNSLDRHMIDANATQRALGRNLSDMLRGEPTMRSWPHWIFTLLALLWASAPFSCGQSTSVDGQHSGTTTGSPQCPLVNGCVDGDASTCFSLFTECVGGSCCRPNFGCLECNCDEQCPSDRPFCTEGLCGECSSNASCPADRPACCRLPGGGRWGCTTQKTGPC